MSDPSPPSVPPPPFPGPPPAPEPPTEPVAVVTPPAAATAPPGPSAPPPPAPPTAPPPGSRAGSPPPRARRDDASPQDELKELAELVVAYAKQETVGEISGLGRYIGLGLAGAVLLGLGVFLLALSGLRALQTETGDTFSGSWSWAPYFIVVTVLLLIASVVWNVRGARRGRGKGR